MALKTKELTHLFTFGFSGSLMPRGLLSSCCEQGLLFAVLRLLTEVASLVAKHQALGLLSFSGCSFWGLEHRLNSCDVCVELLRGM